MHAGSNAIDRRQFLETGIAFLFARHRCALTGTSREHAQVVGTTLKAVLLVKLIEPLCTEPYARWCKRLGKFIQFPFLLECQAKGLFPKASFFVVRKTELWETNQPLALRVFDIALVYSQKPPGDGCNF